MQTSQSKVLTPTTSPIAFYTLATVPCSNHQGQIPDNQGQPVLQGQFSQSMQKAE